MPTPAPVELREGVRYARRVPGLRGDRLPAQDGRRLPDPHRPRHPTPRRRLPQRRGAIRLNSLLVRRSPVTAGGSNWSPGWRPGAPPCQRVLCAVGRPRLSTTTLTAGLGASWCLDAHASEAKICGQAELSTALIASLRDNLAGRRLHLTLAEFLPELDRHRNSNSDSGT